MWMRGHCLKTEKLLISRAGQSFVRMRPGYSILSDRLPDW